MYLYGWIDIWPVEKMIGGENGNLDITETERNRAFEETIIQDNDDEAKRADLQMHRMLESHWGASIYTTVKFDSEDSALYFVDGYGQYKLPLNFSDYI